MKTKTSPPTAEELQFRMLCNALHEENTPLDAWIGLQPELTLDDDDLGQGVELVMREDRDA
jgi:hypothetical protein